MGQLLDNLKIGIITGLTPEILKVMANATGNQWASKKDCENNNPFYWFDTEKSEIIETKESHPITIKKGINY